MAGRCDICGTPFMLGDQIVSSGDSSVTIHATCNKCSKCAGPLGSSVYVHRKQDGLISVICLSCAKKAQAN